MNEGFIGKDGDNLPLDSSCSWHTLEISTKDIIPIYFDAFRRVKRDKTRIRFKPVLIFKAGRNECGILDLNLTWQFINEIIYTERLSSADFKGILQTFVPIAFLEDVLKSSERIIKLCVQPNVAGKQVVQDILTTTYTTQYEPVKSIIEVITKEPIDVKFQGRLSPSFGNRSCVFLWGRKEIEVTEFSDSFFICARYHGAEGVTVQPISPIKYRGRWDNLDATKFQNKLTDIINSLNEAESFLESMIFIEGLLTHHTNMQTTYPSNMTFSDRNKLEMERWHELSVFLQGMF